ncbi:MAG: NFACT family protein [Candidatus Faecalibacterium intestinavium]|uniref:Rqc2 homolog RqcH n=1 Tax=Candidatus Faecalibacterium intestinavium TaxID=2838580 RepID=A0A9E2KIC4_9FIRM|nr:NFACT family protein [Candidatus Faecalibacterium intestinavium]
MALDAATLALVTNELNQTLTDAKIAKLFEPTRDELVLTLRTRTETYSLLLSARSGSARVCLTRESFENPETPPSFCMLMRKHLTGGRLLGVHMEPGDRIVYFDFLCTNEMGDLVQNTLCAELMGRYSNLVLVQNNKIIDALKRVDFEDSEIRQLLPGLPYTVPPKPARPDFLAVSAASIVSLACQKDLPVADALNKTVAGVGPVVCREAAWRAFDGEHLLANELTRDQQLRLMEVIDQLKEEHAAGGCPCSVVTPEGKPVEFTFFRPRQYGNAYMIKEWPSFGGMLEGYYAEKDRVERLRTKSKELHKAVHNMYERAVRKQAARKEELAATEKSEKLRLYGELLSANLYLARKGMKSITVANWYDEGKEITIPLDLRFTPSQNAQNFFKNYKKKQTAARMLVELLAEGEKEIVYLETVLYEVETASGEAALNEIRAELKSQGYLKYYKQRDKKAKPADFLRFTSSDGFEILVGRNNAQNDRLTLHTARGKDLWFHVQKAPGSHVVVMSRGQDIPDSTRQEAAELAVIYSSAYKAGTGAKVAVDTTEVKNIWKAAGAKPGMVLYEVYTTVYITPREELPEQLRKQ